MERLIIRNFGAIKYVNIDLKKINIFIGEQQTGKSTIAKVLCVCRHFPYIYNRPISEINPSNNTFLSALSLWNISDFSEKDTYICYENDDYKIEYRHISHSILIPKSKKFKKLTQYVINNPFYFPIERGLQSIFSLGKIPNISDELFNQLSSLYNISSKYDTETNIEPLDVLYKNEKGKGLVKRKNDNVFYSLNNSGSGFKSTIPIVLGIKYYTEIGIKKTFIVEEPELSLFPTVQRKLISFFIKNINQNEHSFVIYTHSPYILSQLNILLCAFKKGQIKQEATNKIINKNYWLNINDITCYQLKDGKAHSIINNELGLISENIIDEVSDAINEEFKKLLDV